VGSSTGSPVGAGGVLSSASTFTVLNNEVINTKITVSDKRVNKWFFFMKASSR
jgi:hypothetical protein